MNEHEELRAVVRALLTVAHGQAEYLMALHRMTVELYDALRRERPEFESSYEAETTMKRFFPELEGMLARLDELIQQLKDE